MTSTHYWPRAAGETEMAALEAWLTEHGWEVDPTVFMAGAGGAAVQIRRIGAAWQDGEAGLLILPDETVEYDGTAMRTRPRRPAEAGCSTS
ncbi:hypothetical protein ACFC0S_15840 [Streptomyces sp. NPDC056084]|uniref:hypothetical protein n=1 Tax=unclassified Streptomyces TaxID=2593676 RepID=UPI0035DEE6BA